MKLLLDENLPKRLKQDLPEHEVHTVRDQGWNGKKNGELMELLKENGFDCFLTFDKNLQYQQNLVKYGVPVLVLNTKRNSYSVLKTIIPEIKKVLDQKVLQGITEIKEP